MRLIAYMKPYAHWVIFALLLVLGLTAFDLYRPMLVGDAIDTFGANGDYDVIIATAIKYAVVLALSFAFNVAQTWILQKTGQNIILQMRKDLYRHIQSLGSRYFDITPVGKLVTRVTNDVEALNEMYSGILVQLFRNIVKIVGLVGVMLVLDVRLAAISFVLMPLVIGLTVLCQKIARNIYRLYRTRLTDINTFLSEHLSGMKIIQIFGRQERKFEEFHDKNTKLYKAFYREMLMYACLLYTSDAADEEDSVDLGGCRIIKKKNTGETAAWVEPGKAYRETAESSRLYIKEPPEEQYAGVKT